MTRAISELLLASILWGLGFVATVKALEALSVPELLVWRFALAFVLGESIRRIWTFYKSKQLKEVLINKLTSEELIRAAMAGSILAGIILFQTWGLKFTTPARSGFITSLYIVQVPIFLHFFLKQKADFRIVINLFVALVGAAFLVKINFLDFSSSIQSGENKQQLWGDFLTLMSSIFSTAHILYIDRVAKKSTDSFRFNNFQSLTVLLICLPFYYFQPETTLKVFDPAVVVISVLLLSLGASVIAFLIQIRAQKILDPTTASFFFLLEGPFALLFSFLLLQERINGYQTFGIFLIMTACIRQILWDKKWL